MTRGYGGAVERAGTLAIKSTKFLGIFSYQVKFLPIFSSVSSLQILHIKLALFLSWWLVMSLNYSSFPAEVKPRASAWTYGLLPPLLSSNTSVRGRKRSLSGDSVVIEPAIDFR